MLITIMRLQQPFSIISQKFTLNLCQRIIDLVGSTKPMGTAVAPVTSGRRRSLLAWHVDPSFV
tara:strand:+ start:107 stop:295 length:189 start_codon:yes stop_codon:yes gene_type:complete